MVVAGAGGTIGQPQMRLHSVVFEAKLLPALDSAQPFAPVVVDWLPALRVTPARPPPVLVTAPLMLKVVVVPEAAVKFTPLWSGPTVTLREVGVKVRPDLPGMMV